MDKVKTGKLQPGQYISLPNNYSLSRSGNLSLASDDKVRDMVELARSDKYGLDRRDIITYDFHSGDDSYVDVYVSNEDGSLLGVDYTGCADDVYVNGNQIKAEDIPVAPAYKSVDSLKFSNDNSKWGIIIGCIVFIGGVSYASSKFVRYVRRKK